MGIPALVKPVKGQMEQLSNAFALQQLGWGDAVNELTETNIGEWLCSDHSTAPIQYPDVAATLTEWVLEGDWHEKLVMCDLLWECTRSRMAAA
jgi:hypothetical protein